MGCFGGSLADLPFVLSPPSAADVDVYVLHLLPFIVFSWLSGWSMAVVSSLIWLNVNALPDANVFTGIPVVQSVFGVHCAEGT